MLNTGDIFEQVEHPALTYFVVKKVDSFEELQKVVKKLKNVRFDDLNVFKDQGVYPVYMIKTLVAVAELSETPPKYWIIPNDSQHLKSIEVTRGKISAE